MSLYVKGIDRVKGYNLKPGKVSRMRRCGENLLCLALGHGLNCLSTPGLKSPEQDVSFSLSGRDDPYEAIFMIFINFIAK